MEVESFLPLGEAVNCWRLVVLLRYRTTPAPCGEVSVGKGHRVQAARVPSFQRRAAKGQSFLSCQRRADAPRERAARDDNAVVTTNLALFATAAFFEIAGCFAFWTWLRRGASPLVAVLGVVSLILFAVALTRVDSAFAGRAYAAYGGIYIAASLVWLWLAEGQRPSPTDLIGAGIAVAGALLIIGFAPKMP